MASVRYRVERTRWRFDRARWKLLRPQLFDLIWPDEEFFERGKVAGAARVWTRLPDGSIWLCRDDLLTYKLTTGAFEEGERWFLDRYLRDGMAFVDCGAHHGLYTLLASNRVGSSGKVVAFEPSPREARRLRLHLRLNRRTNVAVVPLAVGAQPGDAELHVIDSFDDGRNSLRDDGALPSNHGVSVKVTSLDACLPALTAGTVDVLKIDVEGGELDVLTGAAELLTKQPRPIVMCEIEQERTQAWNYDCCEIAAFLQQRGFELFWIVAPGDVRVAVEATSAPSGNVIAVPPERLAEFQAAVAVNESGPRLTMFSTLKPMVGRAVLVQQNALRSWSRLTPKPEVLIFGDEEGAAEICAELGFTHIPEVARSSAGTPLLSDMFERAEAHSRGGPLCYLNADIILMREFTAAVAVAEAWRSPYLLVAQRHTVRIDDVLDFDDPRWEAQLNNLVAHSGVLDPPSGADVFVFTKGAFGDVAPFAVGRTWFDTWLLSRAAARDVRIIDGTQAFMIVHQAHDYEHAGGREAVWTGQEAVDNLGLFDNARDRLFTIHNARYVMTGGRIRRALGREHRKQHYAVSRIALAGGYWMQVMEWTYEFRHSVMFQHLNNWARDRLSKSNE